MTGLKEMNMQENCFYIQEHPPRNIFHGGIGNMEVERIFSEMGFKALVSPYQEDFSLRAKWSRFSFLIKTLSSLPAGSVVVYQFPLYATLHRWLVQALSKRRKFTVICFIADINGLKDGNDRILRKEIKELKRHHYFIVHNQSMENWLKEFIPDAVTASIDFFDFEAIPFTGNRTPGNEIVFAGNLYKSGFLKYLANIHSADNETIFNVYGEGATDEIKNQVNVNYKGAFQPHELPSKLKGSYGLVWDGDSVEGLAGSLGDYMKYISHHKLSSYIIAGLPLIVPANSAAAELVRKYNIGVTVQSLKDIGKRISCVTPETYHQMNANMGELAKRIIAGYGLRNAMAQLMKSIKK
jgi:glycosyltransferase involved in cell wall biosynthesis